MKKTFNIYCDESTHLLKDGMPYMIIAYVSTAYNQLKQHNQYIKLLKAKHKFKGEIKWSSVSRSQYPFYNDVIEYFFATDLKFRAVIVNKSKIDETREEFTYNDFYFRMYYQLLYHKIDPCNTYNIYLDIKDTSSQSKLVTLRRILKIEKAIRNIQFIKSYESYLMQMTDLLMGTINYHLRGLTSVVAKTNLIKKIEEHTKISLKESTPKSTDKFNLFFIELQ
ncbi:MAG: DUF3800 domain-containing protein [Ignavibacteria bacterium]|nr:DUF3800 domain-containing protein [Bacteroidota bacterium]MBL7128826.1 DUF3800 domain-containing protein [Ignavibacteria bacterium]